MGIWHLIVNVRKRECNQNKGTAFAALFKIAHFGCFFVVNISGAARVSFYCFLIPIDQFADEARA
jgi:hypothetical protein